MDAVVVFVGDADVGGVEGCGGAGRLDRFRGRIS
jgi:hypothetical protein